MPFTRKFSEFPDGGVLATPDMPVGLETGVNTRWTFQGGGGGGGGSVTQVLPQQMPAVNNGDWVRITPASGIYTAGQADTPEDAEIIGIVIESNVATFTLQQSGYITTAMAVPSIVGLTPGTVYFLDTATLGAMVPNDALVDGTVSRPVFVADTATSGWVLPYRGSIVGGQPSPSPTPTPGSDTSLVTINETAHGFIPGDVLRVATPASAGAVTYTKALADTLTNSQAVGVVVANPAPTTNQFTLQFSGYNTGSITTDDLGNPVVASLVYYLSSTVVGKVTSVNPVLAISKPIYVPEQGTANLGVNAGYILPQRPLGAADGNTNVHTVVATNSFHVGQWVYIQSDNTYQLAIATSLATSQVAGVVTAASGTQFTVQQSGWIAGVVALTYIDGGTITTGSAYYLSSVNAGNISITPPITVGQISKPCYIQENATGRIGQILPQRPIVITTPGGGGGNQLITSVNLTTGDTIDLPGIFNGTYQDIYLVGENIRIFNNTDSVFNCQAMAFQLYTGGVLRTTLYVSGQTLVQTGNNNPYARITGVTSSDVRFGVPGVITGAPHTFWMDSSSGPPTYAKTLNFTVNMYGISSSSATKSIEYGPILWATSGIPSTALSTFVAIGSYYGDTLPITGMKFQLLNSGGYTPGMYSFVSGTISIYGTQT